MFSQRQNFTEEDGLKPSLRKARITVTCESRKASLGESKNKNMVQSAASG